MSGAAGPAASSEAASALSKPSSVAFTSLPSALCSAELTCLRVAVLAGDRPRPLMLYATCVCAPCQI